MPREARWSRLKAQARQPDIGRLVDDAMTAIVCILRRHGYPPDKQEKATRTVLEQAEVLSAGWAS